MKINEKFLVAYARSGKGGIQKDGYLSKKGKLNRGYQRRWFVLKGNLLFYFEKQMDRNPIGVIILEDCNVDVCDSDRYAFTLSFFGDRTRIYVLCAESEEEMIVWMKRITVAPYSYAEMVVSELEKKLARLKREQEEAKDKPTEDDDLVGAVANIDIETEKSVDQEIIPIAKERKKLGKTSKAKGSLDRNTIAGHPKSFNNLLTVMGAASTLKNSLIPAVRRSKSSENINKILSSKSPSASPVAPKRKVYQSMMRKKAVTVKTIAALDPGGLLTDIPKPPKKETFVLLHHRYAATVWTTIKDYENEAGEDLLKF